MTASIRTRIANCNKIGATQIVGKEKSYVMVAQYEIEERIQVVKRYSNDILEKMKVIHYNGSDSVVYFNLANDSISSLSGNWQTNSPSIFFGCCPKNIEAIERRIDSEIRQKALHGMAIW